MDYRDFTEDAYREMIRALKIGGYVFATLEEPPTGRHVILRHDCDYSIHRAARMAEIEAQEGVTAAYFLLPRCRFYSLTEPETSQLVASILDAGHSVGLHFDGEIFGTTTFTAETLSDAVRKETSLLETMIERPVRSVTFHNPDLSNLLSFTDDTIAGLTNGYSSRLKNDYIYASDSNGYWRFKPMPEVIQERHDRLYLLTHPEWWTPEPMSPSARIDRAITGRATAARRYYDGLLARAGRLNVGAKPGASSPDRPLLHDVLSLYLSAANPNTSDQQVRWVLLNRILTLALELDDKKLYDRIRRQTRDLAASMSAPTGPSSDFAKMVEDRLNQNADSKVAQCK